jgi:hypothetical protein
MTIKGLECISRTPLKNHQTIDDVWNCVKSCSGHRGRKGFEQSGGSAKQHVVKGRLVSYRRYLLSCKLRIGVKEACEFADDTSLDIRNCRPNESVHNSTDRPYSHQQDIDAVRILEQLKIRNRLSVSATFLGSFQACILVLGAGLLGCWFKAILRRIVESLRSFRVEACDVFHGRGGIACRL